MTLNTELLARLLNYGKVDEDQTLAPPKAAGNDVIGSFSFKGRADMPNRLTNNMGDNAMQDPETAEVDEDARPTVITSDMLDKTKSILNTIGMSDSDLALGKVRLKSGQACIKLVKQVTGKVMSDLQATEFAAQLIQQLSIKLSEDLTDDGDEDQLNEFFTDTPVDARFTYTTDTLGDVMVRDTETDRSVYLRGADAVELLGQLQMHGGTPEQEQEVLAQYQHVMEMGESVAMDEDIQMSDYFGMPSSSMDVLQSISPDLKAIEMKLRKMRADAMYNSDLAGKMAAEIFIEEIENLDFRLKDYLAKASD